MITITEAQAQAILSMMPTKLYSVNMVVVDDPKCSREQCYEELCDIAFIEFGCFSSESVDEVENQTNMEFQFGTALEAFEFMQKATQERPDSAISFVEILDSIS